LCCCCCCCYCAAAAGAAATAAAAASAARASPALLQAKHRVIHDNLIVAGLKVSFNFQPQDIIVAAHSQYSGTNKSDAPKV
jgi:hypothetical protein